MSMLCLHVVVLSMGGTRVWNHVQFVAGQLRVQMPLFLGQLHTDRVADVWKDRPSDLPSTHRQVARHVQLFTCCKRLFTSSFL